METLPFPKDIQQLEALIAQANSIRFKIDAMNQLAWRLRIRQPERARKLSQEVKGLAETDENGLYDQGFAESLITLAFLDSESGNLDTAASRCLEALAYLKEDYSPESLIAAWYTLGWTYFYSGDYPAALEFGLKALNKAEETGIKELEAWALDLAASTYKDSTQSIQMYQKALQYFKELDDIEGQTRTLNNWACILMEMGDYSTALEYGQRSLQLARDGQLQRDEINITSTIGEIYVAMGSHAQAQKYFQKAKQLVESYGSDISYLYTLVGLGEVFLAQNELEKGERELLGALEIATQTEMRNEQARCHQLLSLIYEQHGQFSNALEHYKIFHSLKESVAGESSINQIAALKMSHEIETAQRDAEIQRLKNTQLQLEINEQKRVQSILENLATRDSLTNLYNRRHFLTLAEHEWKRAFRYGHPFSVLMLDLDDFKQINDKYGHATGDQALIMVAGIIQGALRRVEIAGRYGGDEFAIILPETPAEKSLIVGKRIHQEIIRQDVQTKTEPIKLTVSIGIAGLTKESHKQIQSLDEMLHRADRALYHSKGAGKNQISVFTEE